jgi:hypothetical protein
MLPLKALNYPPPPKGGVDERFSGFAIVGYRVQVAGKTKYQLPGSCCLLLITIY